MYIHRQTHETINDEQLRQLFPLTMFPVNEEGIFVGEFEDYVDVLPSAAPSASSGAQVAPIRPTQETFNHVH